ncbi:hypothetical protein Q5P01_013770 [Channa striata]|uniref:Fork-head domain-containing protein n=1 Tax=Channa striata TaxID=64152 RepID=A0AA88SNR6_CHASR|nr:hypothetical protein Q5P01_013770 [Channa striata]
MLSLSCTDPWPEGSVGLQEEVVTAAARPEERDSVISDSNPSDSNICCSSVNLDDSLTSLQWLQEFSIVGAKVPQQAHQQPRLFGQQLSSETPASPLAGEPASIGVTAIPGKPTASAYSRMQSLPGIVTHGPCSDAVDYKTNTHIKPPYTYATLICMAMKASKKTKITLSCIYKWITDNFSYYRHADPTWQNSIRTNLSLNKCFIKVPRQKDEPGKGCFWKIDPQYAERLLSAAYKKTQMPPVQINPALQNRLRVNLQPQPIGPCNPKQGLYTNPESKMLLREFEEATGADQNPHLAGGTRNDASKIPQHSSSPLFQVDEQKEMGNLKGDFDWDTLLDSTLKGELGFESGEPLCPIMTEADLTVQGAHITPGETPVDTPDIQVLVETQQSKSVSDFEEEAFFATAFLESLWPEEEKQDCTDFLCNSTDNLDQLFDL